MKSATKKTLAKVGAAAKWLWVLPPVRSAALTVIARIVGGGTIGAIVVAAADKLAQ